MRVITTNEPGIAAETQPNSSFASKTSRKSPQDNPFFAFPITAPPEKEKTDITVFGVAIFTKSCEWRLSSSRVEVRMIYILTLLTLSVSFVLQICPTEDGLLSSTKRMFKPAALQYCNAPIYESIAVRKGEVRSGWIVQIQPDGPSRRAYETKLAFECARPLCLGGRI